ncbi:hypothetical protein MICRO11B_350003 [Micrococcus luteus]|nr:hypothetical protein MICRO11B_350003 [Micrococcus luteus]
MASAPPPPAFVRETAACRTAFVRETAGRVRRFPNENAVAPVGATPAAEGRRRRPALPPHRAAR